MIGTGKRILLLWCAAALALALVASGCGSDSDDADGRTVGGDDDSTEDDDEDDADEDLDVPTIRDVDFSLLEWREATGQYLVVPADGDGIRGFEIGDIAYADVNDDGHEDALVSLDVSDGNGFERIFYIWTWDAEALEAVQVENPIARDSRCGDLVVSTAAVDGAFEIIERLRRPDDVDTTCASEPLHEAVRHVALSDGWPVLVNGVGGHGGICPQPPGTDDLFPLDGLVPLAGPLETIDTIGVMDDPEIYSFREVDVWSHTWLFREHWMLVHLVPEIREDAVAFAEYGDYIPCGWLFLETDERPIP